MDKEHIKKMQAGREKAAEMYGLICEFKDGSDKFEVHADSRQFILTTNDNDENKSYYHSVGALLTDLLERKEKKIMIADNRNNLIAVREAIVEARSWMEKTIRPFLETKVSEADKKKEV